MPAAAVKQTAKPAKYPDRVYPKEATISAKFNPDNYPLWKAPKNWTEVTSETVAVRCEEALEMLKHKNPANKIRFMDSWARTLTGRVNHGDFNLMEVIEFDSNEALGNGEHRLVAVSQSDGVVLMNVAYGRNPDNYYKYDDNYKRTGGNVLGIHLQMDKKSDTNILSSAASWLIIFWSSESLETRMKIEHADRIETVNNNQKMVPFLKSIRNYATEAGIKSSQLPVTESILLALLTLGAEVNETKTREFIKGVIQGDGLRVGDPIKVYRDFLLSSKDAQGKRRVYGSFKVGQGLFALREHLAGNDIERDGRGEYRLKYNPKKGEPGIPRLDDEQEKLFADERKKLRESAVNRLMNLCEQPVGLTEIAALEGKFFGKNTVKGLKKLGIVRIADITSFTEVGLRVVLKSKALDEVKDVFAALDISLKR